MSGRIPEEWLFRPPKVLVVGAGPYANALAQVLSGSRIGFQEIASFPVSPDFESTPLIWSHLHHVFLVSSPTQSAGDLLAAYRNMWVWVQCLTAEQEEHRLATIFVLPTAHSGQKSSLARGLGLKEIDPGSGGLGIADMSKSLADILAIAMRVEPKDFVTVRNRLIADGRRTALRRLGELMADGRRGSAFADSIPIAAAAVAEQFRGCEYDLDLFCRSPRHPNGNTLRQWLSHAVTGVVTPLEWKEIVAELD